MKTILSILFAAAVAVGAAGVASADVIVREYRPSDGGPVYVYRAPPYRTYYETRETTCLVWPILCGTTTHRHPYVVEPAPY
jgi:hypothetical protein